MPLFSKNKTLWTLLGAAGLLYVLCIHAYYVGFFNDDAFFILLSRSILEGRYVELNQPGTPAHFAYHPGYPFLLSFITIFNPSSYAVYQAFSIFMTLGSLVLIFFLLRDEEPSVRWSTLCLCAFNPLMVDISGTVLSEVPYLFFTLLVFVLFKKWEARKSWREWTVLSAIAAFTFYLRPDGVALGVALVVALLLRRQFKLALLSAIVQGCVVAPYLIRNYLHKGYLFWYGSNFGGSVSDLSSPQNFLTSLSWHLPFYSQELFVRNFFRWPDTWQVFPLIIATVLMVCIGLLLGLYASWKKKEESAVWAFLGIYSLLYIAAHLFWRLQSSRYLYAILPIFYLVFFRGIYVLDRKYQLRSRCVGGLALMSLLLLAVPLKNILSISLFQTTSSNTPPERTYEWIRTQTEPSAIFATEMDGELYLLTGRPTFYFQKRLSMDDFRGWLKEKNISYVLFSNTEMMLKSKSGGQIIDPLPVDYFRQSLGLERVFEDPDEKTAIFRAVQAASR